MALTNAERQARHRERVKAKLAGVTVAAGLSVPLSIPALLAQRSAEERAADQEDGTVPPRSDSIADEVAERMEGVLSDFGWSYLPDLLDEPVLAPYVQLLGGADYLQKHDAWKHARRGARGRIRKAGIMAPEPPVT